MRNSKKIGAILLFQFPFFLLAQQVTVLTNHVGYEDEHAKKAVLMCDSHVDLPSFELVDQATGKTVYSGKAVYTGTVDKWKNRFFWTIDFSAYHGVGTYRLEVPMPAKKYESFPFGIAKNLLEQSTLSDVIYYFKSQRCTGLFDKADHHLALAGKPVDTIDAHGGWYDATGDYGIHLSHLSFSSYFNPQQVSLTAWGLLKAYSLLDKKPGTDFRQYKRRLLDEAMYGADYLARIQVRNGSFYRSVSAPGPGKFARDRVIGAESKSYRIRQSKDQGLTSNHDENNWQSYQSSYRSGAGMAIAALAIASTYDTSGDVSNADYLMAAENAFEFLEKNNLSMTNDGKENIVDDYCALNAATELYRATGKTNYKQAADKRAMQLVQRLSSWKTYQDYWRADDGDRPFFHPSDAGLPLISLLIYYPMASTDMQAKIGEVVRRSVRHELAITQEVSNPFGYSRQLTQDTSGNRRSAFFFPHGSETSPWWQGENARLSSMAAAARMAAHFFKSNTGLHDSLENFAVDQLNWILGMNPYDACMLQGKGHNNPAYGFFGTFEYTNAPGGIVNGITSGLNDEHDIEFNLAYKVTGKDYDWRWAEQWLPHATWYLLAVCMEE